MPYRTAGIRRFGGRRKLTLEEYKEIEEHLKTGGSFWSSHARIKIGVNALERFNREDPKIKEIRMKYDDRYRVRIEAKKCS